MVFRIRRLLTTIMIVDTVLLFALFLCTVFFGGGLLQVVLSGFFALLLALVSWEMSRRAITLDCDRLILRKFHKRREIMLTDITELDALPLRQRVHFLITSRHGFYFFSNAYADIYSCLRLLQERVGDEEKVTAAFKHTLAYPAKNNGDVIAGVIAGVAVVLIMYLKFS